MLWIGPKPHLLNLEAHLCSMMHANHLGGHKGTVTQKKNGEFSANLCWRGNSEVLLMGPNRELTGDGTRTPLSPKV